MTSCKAHYYMQYAFKKVHCFFNLNQMCQVNPLMTSKKHYATQCCSYNYLFQKFHSHGSLLNKPKTISRSLSQTKTCSQVLSYSKLSSLSPLNRVTSSLLLLSTASLVNSSSPCTGHQNFHTTERMGTQVNASHMVWVDCEMTGLDTQKDCILEIALIITDADLNVVDQTEIVVNKPEEILQGMNEWCVKQHGASGLTNKVRASTISTEQADEMVTQFVAKYVAPQTAPMIGNSVYMDRIYIMREFPKFNKYLHYRIIDVSSLKELCKTYNPDLYKKVPEKRRLHRGLEDIEDTIEEFKFYKQHFLKIPANVAEFSSSSIS